MTTMGSADEGDLPALAPVASGWDGDPRAIVVNAFQAAVTDAEVAASAGAEDQDGAVHEYRKALRRARAILALVRPVLARDTHDAVRDELRSARREVSAARDHTVAATALAQLALESQEREGADFLLTTLRTEEPTSEDVCAHLQEGAHRARLQCATLEAALPGEVSMETIARGLARTYRQARTARRGAKRSRRAFHRWRRRTKELDAQLALLAAHAGERTESIRQAYSDLSNVLGPIADLIMLRTLSAEYRARHSDAPFADLEDALGGLASVQIRAARKLARPLFAPRPAKLTKMITRALRRDSEATPPLDGDDPGDSED